MQSVPAISFSSSNSISSEQSAPAAPLASALLADNRNLENRKQQGQVLSPGVQDAQARDVSKGVRTKKQLAEGVAEALFHSNKQMKQLAEVCKEFGEVMMYESMRTTEMQQWLECNMAEAQHAHQTERCTRLSATSAALVEQVSATLDQLEPFRAAGGLVSGSQWQSVGLDQVEP